jgi:hypothetical protein
MFSIKDKKMAEVNAERAQRIVDKITELWTLVPEWRFGQLVENAFKARLGRAYRSDAIFYTDDEKLEEGLDVLIERFRNDKSAHNS